MKRIQRHYQYYQVVTVKHKCRGHLNLDYMYNEKKISNIRLSNKEELITELSQSTNNGKAKNKLKEYLDLL